MNTERGDRRSGTDRRTRHRRRFHERRSGFDRRAPVERWDRIMDRYRRNSRAIWLVLALITALNIGDIVFTRLAVAGGAVEGNPFLAPLVHGNFLAATIVKVVVVGVVVSAIWALRRFRLVLEFSLVVLMIFAVIFAYHLFNAEAYWAGVR